MFRRRLPGRRSSVRTGLGKNRSGLDIFGSNSGILGIGLLFFIVVLIVLIATFLFFFYWQRQWDGKERLTMAIQIISSDLEESDVFVVSFLPGENELSILSLPAELKIETPGGSGFWRVSSIYGLGEIDGVGGRLLSRSLSDFLGTEIEGWVVMKDDTSIEDDNHKKNIERVILYSLTSSDSTNFRISDRLSLLFFLRSVRKQNISYIDLATVGILSDELQPDGSKLLVADPDRLDRVSFELFSEPIISNEAMSVAVLNATNHGGLGRNVARLLRNMGFDVVVVDDYKEKLLVTEMIVFDKSVLSSFTAGKLEALVSSKSENLGDVSQFRADLAVVIGEDYWEKFMSP